MVKLFSQNPKSFFRSILRSATWISIEGVFSRLILFIIQIKIINYLGPEKFGLLSISIVIISLLESVFDFGTTNTTINYLNKNKNKNQDLSNYLLFKVLSIILIIALISLFTSLGNLNSLTLIFSLTIVPSIFNYVEVYFKSQNEFKPLTLSKIASTLLFIILILFFINRKYSLEFIVIAYIAERILYFATLTFCFSKLKFSFNINATKKLFLKSYPLGLSVVFFILSSRIDQLFINFMLSEKELGIFTSGMKLSDIFLFPVVILSSALYQPLLKLKLNSFQYVVKVIIVVSILYSVFIIGVFYFFSDSFINYFFDEEFHELKSFINLYVFSLIPQISFFILGIAFKIKEEYASIFRLSIYSLLINVFLNGILIKFYGINGAIFSTIISGIIYNALLVNLSIKREIIKFSY